MNVLLLSAGLLPLIIFSVVFIIKKKGYLLPAASLVCSTAIIVVSFFIPSGNNSDTSLSPDRVNYLANVNMASGNIEKAESYLTDMYKSTGDTYEGLLSYMRLNILKGDMDSAKIMAKTLSVYMERNDAELTDFEKEFVENSASDNLITSGSLAANKALYTQLKNAGVNPADYGYNQISDDDITTAKKAEEKLKENVSAALQSDIDDYNDNKSGTLLQTSVSNAAKLNNSYLEMINSGDDKEAYLNDIKKMTKLLHAAYVKDNEIFNLPEVRDAYILGAVTTEDYDSLIEYGADSNDNTAISVIANLYISGTITDKDFPRDFSDTSDYSNVVEKCEDILSSTDADDYSNAEMDSLHDYVESVTIKNKQPVLSELEKRLTPEAASDSDKSGLYIQDSGLNSELSDKDAAFDSLNNAINHLNESNNDELKNALDEINSIADNSSVTDNITNLSDYLEAAYKSSLPLDSNLISVPESYLNTSNSYVNEKRAMINIGIINTENFSEVKAYVSTSGTDLTDKDKLIVADCGMTIDDYTIEKVKYDLSQIYLVCDNSGSMSGNIDALKTAVEKFINSKGRKEKIGIVTFDNSVIMNTGLTDNKSELLDGVDKFNSYGGTNIGCGVDAAFDGLSSSDNSFNVLIVMTDGQDNSYASQTALNDLRKRCNDNNVILYTIGLGDVNADYLKNVADSGMGSFIYSNDGVQLEELYSFIHNQLDNNYVITYTAKDTTTLKDRLLTITNTEDGYKGKRSYSLDYENDEDDKNNDGLKDNPDGISVNRLGVSTIIKGASDSGEFTILGSGFDKAEGISVSLTGDKQYSNLACSVTNDKKLTVTLPATVKYDTYDVSVTINGNTYILKGLSVLKPGSSQSVAFGDYIFTAMSITTNGNDTYLKGNVTMNDYLHFNGDVKLSGNLEGNTLMLSENSGSYITYSETLPGLLGLFFDNVLYVPSINSVTLYSNGDTFDKSYLYGMSYYGPLFMYDPYIELHPDYVQMTLSKMSIDFPVLNNLLDYVESPISGTGKEQSFVLTKDTVGIIYTLESSVGIGGRNELHLGPATLGVSSFNLGINTIKNDYNIGMSVGLEDIPIFKDSDGVDFGFDIGIKGGSFDSLDLGADIDIPIVTAPPVSLADFHAGVEGLASETQTASFASKLLGATWYGQCDVNFFNLNEIIPGLDSILGNILDITILALDDTKLSLTISNFNISLDTTAKLLEVVNLGQLEVDLGNYKYTNYLLGIDSSVAGIHLKTSNSLGLDFGNNFNFNISGSSQVDINNMFAGVMSNGAINYNLKIFKKFTGDIEGNFLIGIHNKASQFTILVKGDDYANNKDGGVRITFSKNKWFPDVTLY